MSVNFCCTLLMALVALPAVASTNLRSTPIDKPAKGRKEKPADPSGIRGDDATTDGDWDTQVDVFKEVKESPPTPNLVGYTPDEILCHERGVLAPWCHNWLKCIKYGANPKGDENTVKMRWAPADCNTVCGVWPSMLQGDAKLNASDTAIAHLLNLGKSVIPFNECLASCHNFQESLVSCVVTIMFEPGKLASMMPKIRRTVTGRTICTRRDTKCLPTLAVEYQKCLGHKTKEKYFGGEIERKTKARCTELMADYKECMEAKCPQMAISYGSKYAFYVGGCRDQLHSYYQATDPQQGAGRMPDALESGCPMRR